jgi:hypothetical protein
MERHISVHFPPFFLLVKEGNECIHRHTISRETSEKKGKWEGQASVTGSTDLFRKTAEIPSRLWLVGKHSR